MTEADALTKWCPFARQMIEIKSSGSYTEGPIAVSSANRFNDAKGTLCIGSNCMAWRWDESPRLAETGRHLGGHCGLAGI